MALKIVWNKTALENISEAIKWISKDSIQQAENVENAIVDKIEELIVNPNKYPPDKFKINNSGNYRAFETHSYRISYRITNTTIRILRIRHVKQEPKKF